MHHLPRTDEKDGVGSLCRNGTAVEADDGEFPHLVMQFVTEPSKLTHVERAKIKEEVPVD